MHPTAPKTNLLGLNRQGLEDFCAGIGERPFRAAQLMQWIHHHGVTDFGVMSNLSKALRDKLCAVAEVRAPEVVMSHRSQDGTCKWLLRLDSGNCIETVFIPEEKRGTLCISSQVGCALDCSFCATAQQGFNRNLTVHEIIGQVWQAAHALGLDERGERPLTNVVLMGMGEPLANFEAVVTATQIMQDDFAYGLSKRRVTLSTAGMVPQLYRLREVSDIALAVSLHAPDDVLRDQLVPLNKKYPIAELLAACWHYVADSSTRRRVTFEYVLLDGINDTPEHAHALVKLLRHKPAKVNLIPFNPFPGTPYRRSSPAAIERFVAILTAANITALTRRTRGDDIAAACGQLAGQVQDRSRRVMRRAQAGMPLAAVVHG